MSRPFQSGVLILLFYIAINTLKEPDIFKSVVITGTMFIFLFWHLASK